MSFKAEVKTYADPQWCPNGLAFETRHEASLYVARVAMRWTLVTDTRVVESEDPINAVQLDSGETVYLGSATAVV